MTKIPAFSPVRLEQRICDESRLALLFFASLAAILFSPFFVGKFAIGGTDVLYAHYPNILFGYREFWEFGHFSLWNRYIFAGTDFSASMHAHYLNPLYWPLLIFPEKYIFHALTAGFVGVNVLTGWIWSRIGVRCGVSGMGSLIVGVVAQAGMFFWFSMTTLIAVPMYLCASIAIYVIVTHETRRDLANYVSLSLVLALLFVTPHPSYILGFFLPILVLFLAHAYPGWFYRPWRGLTPIFTAACLTALLLSAYRLVPVAAEIVGKGAFLDNMWLSEYLNHAYFGLTAFNPLALGISLFDSQVIGQMLHLEAGRHTQAHNALYFGIAPLVIIYAALRLGDNTKVKFLAVTFLFLQLSYLYAFQPLSDIIYLVIFPLGHEGIYRPASAIAFLFLLIESLKGFTSATPTLIQKTIRECVVISGFVIGMWGVMYAKVLYGMPDAVNKLGFHAFTNSFRVGLLCVIVGTIFVCRLPLHTIARPRFGVMGVLFGLTAVIIAAGVALASGLLSGGEIWLRPVKNGATVVLICIAVLVSLGFGPSQARRRVIIICGIAATVSFLFVRLPSFGNGVAASAWAATIGWGAFIAVIATTLTIMALLANRTIHRGTAITLMLVLTLVDLGTSFDNYSYVNVHSTPFIRNLDQIYPTQTLPERVASYRTSLADQRNLPNLLNNAEFRQDSGQLTGWAFGGKDMARCTRPNVLAMTQGNAIRVCYPGNDAEGNLYQDVSPIGVTRQVSMGVWVRTEPSMEVSLFLTSPSNNVGGAVVRQKGDGKWHWLRAKLAAEKPLKVVRPHINLAKPGYAEIYAPTLISGLVVRSALRPSDGHEIVEPKDDLPQKIDLESYRVNHVHMVNGYSSNEMMTNFAIVAKTPTYSGVDSDFPSIYVAFLKAFKAPDPSWFHRAGLYSVIENRRFLDLMGVAYDIDELGGIVVRHDAIPRFAAFSAFEVLNGQDATVQRLKDDDFDPTTTVLLEALPSPGLANSLSTNGRFQHLTYATPEADSLSVKISAERPRLIVFNDRFSRHWEASWNGNPLQIIRANGIFMAVAVPAGAGELTFSFHPTLFMFLVKFSAATATLLFLLSVAGILRARLVRIRPSNLAPMTRES